MIDWITDKQYWQPALDQSGNDRTDAWIINATDIIPLTNYPPGTKLFLRAEPLHPGAQPSLLDTDGHRITAFLTNSPRWHGPLLDARHRARGRCENRNKTLKNTGLGKLPFFDFATNQAWANIAALALNLVSWIQLAALPDGHPGKGPPETSPGEQCPAQQRARSFHRLIVELILSQRTARSPEVEPAPTQANQQATRDCPKTENSRASAAATYQRPSTSIMKNRG